MRKHCLKAYLLLNSLNINNILEQKRLEIKNTFLKTEYDGIS